MSNKVTVVSAGVGTPSTTRMVADRIATEVIQLRPELTVSVIDLSTLAGDLAGATVTGMLSPTLRAAVDRLTESDGLIAATPVYKASYSGLFKSFFDVVEDDALLAMPVTLVATAGSPRHALVPDTQMRPLFAYLRAMPLPTSVFAATEDWGDSGKLADRIKRAATELVVQITAEVRSTILTHAGKHYRRTFADHLDQVDFDTDLMRLATGG